MVKKKYNVKGQKAYYVGYGVGTSGVYSRGAIAFQDKLKDSDKSRFMAGVGKGFADKCKVASIENKKVRYKK